MNLNLGSPDASPWTAVPASPPYALPQDLDALASFNRRAKIKHRVEFDALPEPFIGPLDARLVLLSLNPGWNDQDPIVHARPRVAALLRKNLAGEATSFYYLEDALSDSPGAIWWGKRLAPLIRTVGQRICSRLMVVEWFPYHSRHFADSAPQVDSQQYSFQLVRNAVARGAWILGMRAEQRWFQSVPELARYDRFARLKNRQNVSVSPGNCARFTELLNAFA